MDFHLIDYILLAIIAGFTWIGLWSGFIHTLGSFLGVFLGAALAARYYIPIAGAWDWVFFGNEKISQIVIFIFIFILISRAVGLIFWLANKIFGVIKLFPFLGSLNRLLGAVLGFLEGVLILATVIFLISKYQISPEFTGQLKDSSVTQILLTMAAVIKPLMPAALKNLSQFGK